MAGKAVIGIGATTPFATTVTVPIAVVMCNPGVMVGKEKSGETNASQFSLVAGQPPNPALPYAVWWISSRAPHFASKPRCANAHIS